MNKKILFLTFALLIFSACATPAGRTGRVGLLERGGNSSRGSSRYASSPESIADEPNAGGKVKLSGEWQWPLENIDVSSPFGERGRKFHQGIDLRAMMKTPVFAAADGEVSYVGSKIRGYGRMVVLKHANNVFSVYAHHSKNLVKAGAIVKRGDQIALSGRSGHAHGPHLHFEIRNGTASVDPEFVVSEYLRSHPVDRRFASVPDVKQERKSSRKSSRKSARPRSPRNPKMASGKNNSVKSI